MMLTLVLVALAISRCNADWSTCEDQPFCNNIRYDLLGEITYSLTNVDVEGEVVTARLVNDQNSDELNFRLVTLEGKTVRFTVQDEGNTRYTPENDALVGSPIQSPFTVVTETDDAVELSLEQGINIHLNFNPFRIDVYENGEHIIVVNKNNRLIINTSEEDRSLALDFSFPLAQRAYGIPQHAERLSLPSTGPEGLSAFRMFNVDNYGYPAFTREAVYGSIGVLYGISTTITSGIFWMNAAQTFVDIDNRSDGVDAHFISETGALEVFLFGGPTLKDCVRQFTALTGFGPLPQYYNLGYHQSRYSYMSQEDVETVVDEFDNNDFPMDAIWLDIDYTDGYRYFTWNYETFPDPIGMQEYVASTGRKMVAISDPHIKVDPEYFVYSEGLEGDYFVKTSDDNVFEGECWPGLSTYVDFFNEDAQEWYGDLYSLENFPNSTVHLHIWNDMNEPSVFEEVDTTMPANLRHAGGWEHRDVHNMYGLKQTQATKTGLLRREPDRRPFILTRAHFAGSQRYAAMWTGDNSPTWEHLQVSVPMVLTESLAGMAFCGADVGGFTGNVTDDLLQRWYQAGIWYPFYRGHSGADTERREPYLFDTEIQARVRQALQTRYKHLPYWYTLFFEHERTGDPIVRPLSYQYPEDASVLDIDTQWLIGSNIMAAPVLNEDVNGITTYFPGGANEYWYNIEGSTPLVYNGIGNFYIPVTMDSNPYYYRGGSIILRLDEKVRNTEEQRGAAYNMYICKDSNGQASGTFYLDDWVSFEYKDEKKYHYFNFIFDNNRLTLENIDEEADYEATLDINTIYLYGVTGSTRDGVSNVSVNTFKNKVAINKMKARSKTTIPLA
ncbi:alpha-glucosidase [Holotrichia oblita]|uniref:Alpha-glucosidase n=1 Tax=Holotrichia oblita TaxID=644536 RepID=A0ACB9ST24_HOLOL|nr:alpha-glucosidase [Holotrichia oblita]